MKITRMRTAVVDIPFESPVGVGYAQLRSSGLVLIFLETDEGLVGEGLIFSLNAQFLDVLHALARGLEPFVLGLDPNSDGAFGLRATAALRFFGMQGFSVMACAGIEEALLDLRGKAAGLNVSRLLGACRDEILAYHSGDLWVNLSIDELQASAQRHLERGFRAMKMRLTGRLAIDAPRVRAVRDVVGPDVLLMADANQKMNVPEAIRLGCALEEFNLTWLEEPVSAQDHAGEARVARAVRIPIASGESVYTSLGAKALLDHGSVDVLMPDLQRMGGPREFAKAAALAEAAQVRVSGHLFSEMTLGLMCSISNADMLEFMPWVSPIYREQIELDSNGRAIASERPGWGFSFDPDQIKRFAI